MYLADFHIHSNFSDGVMSIPEIVDFYGEQGFGAIAVTDHICESSGLGKAAAYLGKTLTQATFPLYQQILKTERKRAWAEYGMLLIPGFEVTKNSLFNHRAAHVVALGATEWISADQDLKQIARSIRNQGGFAVAAHPLSPNPAGNKPYYLWDRRHELRDEFDAWEITYGAELLKEVFETDLPKIATSDLHQKRHIRSWKTGFSCARSEEALFEAIRYQDVKFEFYSGEGVLNGNLRSGPLGSRLWGESLGNLAFS